MPGDEDVHHHVYEKLEHEIQLKNLVNPESLGNVVRQFADFHNVRLTVTELDGTVLCGEEERPRLCVLRHGDDDGHVKSCKACAKESPEFADSTEKFSDLLCRSEVRYVRARVDNQFEPAGYVILGPFSVAPPPALAPGAQQALADAYSALPQIAAERAVAVARLMCIVVEELVFANYQSYLFSKMHLQLSNENIGEVTSQGEDETYDQMLDSSEFSSLF